LQASPCRLRCPTSPLRFSFPRDVMASHMRLFASWLISCVAVLGLASSGRAAEVKLARHPDYHNGRIVFSYLGDLWLMNEGSQPRRVTVHKARDIHPRFS